MKNYDTRKTFLKTDVSEIRQFNENSANFVGFEPAKRCYY